MKKIMCLLIASISIMSSCSESPYKFFDTENRVQMQTKDDVLYSFFYEPATVTEKTVYLNVQAVGLMKNYPQRIVLEQVPETYIEYKYDNNGVKIDSTVREYTNKGVSGVHYVALDDPRVSENLVIPANTYLARVPIIVKRDAALKKGDIRICFRLKASSDLLLCQQDYLQQTIILSDRLPKPTGWLEYLFGDYSTVKHEFMITVAGEKIDDAWMEKITNTGSGQDRWYLNKFRNALDEFNKDQTNIDSGKAPLRENPDDPNSKLISF